MSESRVRENLMHGLMRGKRAKPSNLLYKDLVILTYESEYLSYEIKTLR